MFLICLIHSFVNFGILTILTSFQHLLKLYSLLINSHLLVHPALSLHFAPLYWRLLISECDLAVYAIEILQELIL